MTAHMDQFFSSHFCIFCNVKKFQLSSFQVCKKQKVTFTQEWKIAGCCKCKSSRNLISPRFSLWPNHINFPVTMAASGNATQNPGKSIIPASRALTWPKKISPFRAAEREQARSRGAPFVVRKIERSPVARSGGTGKPGARSSKIRGWITFKFFWWEIILEWKIQLIDGLKPHYSDPTLIRM